MESPLYPLYPDWSIRILTTVRSECQLKHGQFEVFLFVMLCKDARREKLIPLKFLSWKDVGCHLIKACLDVNKPRQAKCYREAHGVHMYIKHRVNAWAMLLGFLKLPAVFTSDFLIIWPVNSHWARYKFFILEKVLINIHIDLPVKNKWDLSVYH